MVWRQSMQEISFVYCSSISNGTLQAEKTSLRRESHGNGKATLECEGGG